MTRLFAHVVMPASFLAATFLPYLTDGALPQSGTARRILPLQLEEQIPVPEVSGRLDHFTLDAKPRRLIFSALGNNTVEVIDTFAGKVIHTIRDLSALQGVLYVAEFDQLFAANAVGRKVSVFAGANYEFLRNIDFGEEPDNLRYDPVSKKVLVGCRQETGGIGRIEPATGKRVGSDLKTGGHPESFQLDASGERLFVNVPDAVNVVEAFDLKSGAMEKWALGGLRQNYALAVDEHHVLLPDVPSTIGAKTGFRYEQRDRMYVGVPARGNDPGQVCTYEAED